MAILTLSVEYPAFFIAAIRYSMASSRTIKIEFFGRTAHATLPHSGIDALAAAVKTYNNIQFMLTREMNPFDNSARSANSSCVKFRATRSSLILFPIFMLETPFFVKLKINKKFSISQLYAQILLYSFSQKVQ